MDASVKASEWERRAAEWYRYAQEHPVMASLVIDSKKHVDVWHIRVGDAWDKDDGNLYKDATSFHHNKGLAHKIASANEIYVLYNFQDALRLAIGIIQLKLLEIGDLTSFDMEVLKCAMNGYSYDLTDSYKYGARGAPFPYVRGDL